MIEQSVLDKIKAVTEEAKKLEKKPEKKYKPKPCFLDGIKTKEQADLFKLVLNSLLQKEDVSKGRFLKEHKGHNETQRTQRVDK